MNDLYNQIADVLDAQAEQLRKASKEQPSEAKLFTCPKCGQSETNEMWTEMSGWFHDHVAACEGLPHVAAEQPRTWTLHRWLHPPSYSTCAEPCLRGGVPDYPDAHVTVIELTERDRVRQCRKRRHDIPGGEDQGWGEWLDCDGRHSEYGEYEHRDLLRLPTPTVGEEGK